MKYNSRKNFLPTLIMSIFGWALMIGFILFLDPDRYFPFVNTKFYYNRFLFFLLLFWNLWLNISIILANTRKGFLAAFLIELFFILKIIDRFRWKFFIIISGLVLIGELIISKYQKKKNRIKFKTGIIE